MTEQEEIELIRLADAYADLLDPDVTKSSFDGHDLFDAYRAGYRAARKQDADAKALGHRVIEAIKTAIEQS